MLTTTRTSRARLLTGAGALTVLAAAGLGLTASGTAAAAKVRTTVETATGVSFTGVDQAAPVAPAAPAPLAAPSPAVAEAPPAPKTPHVAQTIIIRDGDASVAGGPGMDEHAKVIRILRRDKDGKTMSDDVVHVPDVSTVNCKSDGKSGVSADKMVLEDSKDGKHKIILCINRIQQIAEGGAAKGAAMAANSHEIERNAYRQALAGLRKARAEMVAKQGESGGHSSEALPAIDTAIAEIEADLAGVE